MYISELSIEGYKSLRETDWRPGKLNVIIGPNGSGKSNLLSFLRLLRSCATGDLNDQVLMEGGMSSVLWTGTKSGQAAKLVTECRFILADETSLVYILDLKQIGVSASYVIQDEQLVNDTALKNDKVYISRALGILSRDGLDQYVFRPKRSTRTSDNETFLSQLSSHLNEYPTAIYVENITSWCVLDNIHTERGAEIRRPAIARYEERLADDAQNLVSVLHTHYSDDRDFQENIDRAMSAAFGGEYDSLVFPPAGSQNVELAIRWNSIKRPRTASVLSDGTLRFLAIITALSVPKLPSLICIDEPETGLHPSMLPIIAEYAANASERTQVVFTTHSVQFLDAFADVTPTTTVAQIQDGETKLVTLDGERLAYWLKEYSLGTLFQSGELENMAEDAQEQSNGAAEMIEAVVAE